MKKVTILILFLGLFGFTNNSYAQAANPGITFCNNLQTLCYEDCMLNSSNASLEQCLDRCDEDYQECLLLEIIRNIALEGIRNLGKPSSTGGRTGGGN